MAPLTCVRAQVRVTAVNEYSSFYDMLVDHGVHKFLPDHGGTIDEAVEIYRSFGTTRGNYQDLEKLYGAVAIEIAPLQAGVFVASEAAESDEEELIPAIGSYEADSDCDSDCDCDCDSGTPSESEEY